jgi:hypothetical protein
LNRRVYVPIVFLLAVSTITLALAVGLNSDSNLTNVSGWIQLGPQDNNEGGSKNDWLDVKFAFFNFDSSADSISLKLECYGNPGNDWPKSGGRYKWFIDITNPSDMHLSGGKIVAADYLVYVEDSDDDGHGDMYILEDTDFDGDFNDETPSAISDSYYAIEDKSITIDVNFELIGNPVDMALTWATDQEDPNKNAAPNNDRFDGKIGIAGLLSNVTFNQTGVTGDFEGAVLAINGENYGLSSLPISFWALKGSEISFDYKSPLVSTPENKRFVWNSTTGLSSLQSGFLTVSSSGTVTGNYESQYYLKLTTSPPELTTPSGEGWYDADVYASIATDEFVGIYRFETWTTEDALEIADVNSTFTTVLMDKAGTVTATFLPAASITVNNIVVGEPPNGVWKYLVTGPDDYSESFNLPAGGSPPTWFSGYGTVAGDYGLIETTKFGYHTRIDIQGDVDSGSVITGSKVIVDLDEGESVTVTFTNTFLPAFAISLDSAPPSNLEYDLPPLTPKFAQSAWSTDINGDGKIDLVFEKPSAVMVNFTGVSVGSSVSVAVNFLGNTYGPIIKTNVELAANSIFSFYPIIPDVVGATTLTGSYSVDGGAAMTLPSVDVTVKETTGPPIAYSHLYKVNKKGNLAEYEEVSLDDYLLTVGNSTSLINTTYPVSSLVTDESYVGLEGANKGSRKDPFKGLLTDALAVAQNAQLRMGGTAIGIGIGPNNPGIDDYFTYHGFTGAAGISFGPSVKGVLILDGFYGGSAHEVAHTYGLYYGIPEQYQINPLYGKIASGVRVETGEWMTGYDIMGAVAYGTLEDTWIDSDTFSQLFSIMANYPEDPQILLASGIINSNGTVEFPNTWYSLAEGIPDTNLMPGDYALIFVDENGSEIAQTSFDAQFEVQIGGYPAVEVGTDGDLISQTAFETMETNSTGFSFAIPYYTGTAEVQIWNLTSNEQIGVVDANDIVHLEHFDVNSWTTSSNFDDITNLDAVFKKDGKTKTSILTSTNPGTMYLNFLVENREAYTINPTVKITLPDAEDSSSELVSPAFNLKGANPIHVYSDLERTNDITQNSVITINGKTINIELTIPENGLAYVIIHLDYALKETNGWPFDASQTYLQNLPFDVYAPHIMENGSVITNITVPFEVIGSENT